MEELFDSYLPILIHIFERIAEHMDDTSLDLGLFRTEDPLMWDWACLYYF